MVPQLENIHSGYSRIHISKLIFSGIIAACLDDKKIIWDNILTWLAETFGDEALGLARLDKQEWGLRHPLTGALLCPVNLDWDDPLTQEAIKAGSFKSLAWGWLSFVYAWGLSLDPENMWEGFFRSPLLVAAYKRIFTSRSSLYVQMQLNGSTQPGDCCLYGMVHVTPCLIAYIAMQFKVHFALGSCRLFTLNNALTSSRKLYESMATFFDCSSNDVEMRELLAWWDE
ncbi:hypothetical protein DXG01_005291 [Tephrocybe rancida]|nr:hypothetical protein DXG01_005291 [Tephrocybe rancida]